MPLKRRGATDWGFGLSVGTTWTSTKSSCPQKSVQTLQLWSNFFLSSFHIVVAAASISLVHVFLVEFVTMRVLSWSSLFHISLTYKKKTMIFHFSNTCARENYRIRKFITELSCVTCNYLPVSSGSFWGAVP